MHKKDGKVYASLTEVKNKTGDIFAIVDEYGEIFLTSYNKIRYKISKEDIHGVLNIEERKEKAPSEKKIKAPKAKKAEEPQAEKPASKEDNSIFDKPVIKEPAITKIDVAAELINKTIAVVPWDRNNMFEKNFTEESMKPLISN
jgi:hypothetical protein